MMQIEPDSGGMLVSISEAARLKGVRKQTIAEKLSRLGDRVPTMRRGRERVFSLALYDLALGEITDPAKLVARDTQREIAAAAEGSAPEAPEAADPTYREQLRRKAGYDADLKELELRTRRGELLEIDDVRDAAIRLGEQMLRAIGEISARSEEIAGAVARNGAAGAREIMRTIERDLRRGLSDGLAALATPSADDDDDREAA